MNPDFPYSFRGRAYIAIGLALTLMMSACGGKGKGRAGTEETPLSDTLKIGTLYSPTSYFEYRDSIMGYDYTLGQRLAKDLGRPAKFVIASSLPSMLDMLEKGEIDVVAYDVPITAEYLEEILPCGKETISSQVLVQKAGDSLLTDVTQLVGKEVYVEKDSKYFHRMQNLDEEVGGGITIHEISKDSIITQDMLTMISEGTIPYTVVDSDIAAYNKEYYPGLDFSLNVSFPQRSSWAVAKSEKWLADTIDSWFARADLHTADKELLRKYFEFSLQNEQSTDDNRMAADKNFAAEVNDFSKNFSKGYISEYDRLFRQYAPEIGWDWRMLAAVGYAESRFTPKVESWAGAKGLMQIMPSTARAYGVSVDRLNDPEQSVALSVKIFAALDRMFENDVPDPKERLKFVLAAYNCGGGHIKDAIRIARHEGLNPEVWNDNVGKALRLKSEPEYYNNKELSRCGYCRGNVTAAYVSKIMRFYDEALKSDALV